MLTFHHVNVRNALKLRRYYKNCTHRLCEYSVGTKLMWRQHTSPLFAEAEGCLIVKHTYCKKPYFDFPVPMTPDGDVTKALDAIDAWCVENGVTPNFLTVPEEKLPVLTERYPLLTTDCNRIWCDYLYHAADLITFAGRKYSGQRNHINKFKKLYPDAFFRPITPEDAETLDRFWTEFHKVFNKDSSLARKELCYARKLTEQIGKSWCLAGAIELHGEFIAISLAEICGDTLVCHIEKALPQYEGIYPTMVQAFAAHFGKDCTYINREDDGGDRGLRTSKTQYLPVALGKKYKVETAAELSRLVALPTISTERLVLSELTRADIPVYNRLCLDDDRNRYWGYDYRKDLKGQPTENYFYRVAQIDFKHRLAANFAIRLDGQLIGEAVLYHFDGKGNAELGLRILPEFAGHGYGREAFEAVANWSLYDLGITALQAKCYHENESSQKMLSACMRPKGQDETFLYFEKKI